MYTQKTEVREQLYYCKAAAKPIYLERHYKIIMFPDETKEHLQKTGCSNAAECIQEKRRCPLKIFQLK